ncbi:MAG TPA: peptide ABC transporter substrate-binding protein [Candidatus Paceibacterota bacterium]
MFSKFHKIFDAFTKSEREIFQGAAIVLAISALLNGVNVFYQETKLAPVKGGAYTEGLVGQPTAINPFFSSNGEVDRDLIELVFSDLAELASSIKPSGDRKTWNIELKTGTAWSDGAPLTADDVIFTIETVKNPEARSPAFQTWQNVAAEKINEREVRFTLKTPYAFFLESLKNFKIIPEHIFGAIPAANLRISDYNFEPVGSGPYSFVSYEKRRDGFITQYTFAANQFFAGSKPLINELRFEFFPNYDEVVAAFNKKEIDGFGGLPPNLIDKIKINHELKEIGIPRYYAIFFNQSIKPALKNKEIRRALGLAVNRGKIISEVFFEKAIPITGPIYPGIEGYLAPGENASQNFSPDSANEILDSGGWLPEADGIRAKKIGSENTRLEFEIIVPQIDFLVKAAEIIKEDWLKIGIALKLNVLSPSEIGNDIIRTRNYEMVLFGNILKSTPDIFSFWHSSERFFPGLNLALYENKTVDELLESVRKNFSEASRIKELRRIQLNIAEDLPALFLFSPNYIYVSPKDLGGFNAKSLGTPSNRFDEINKWFLKTARVFK